MKHLKTPGKISLSQYERGADRFDTALPVEIGGIKGLTRNISATGIYFEAAVAQAPGSHVNLTVEVKVRGEKLKLLCEGEVVRVDHYRGVLGIAAKLENSFFSDVAEVIRFKPGARTDLH